MCSCYCTGILDTLAGTSVAAATRDGHSVSETAAGQQRRAGEGCVGPCSPAHEQVHRTAAPPPAAALRTTGKTHTEPTPRHRWAVVSATRVSARQGIPVQIGEARVRFRRWRSRRAAGLRHACVDHERRWRNRGLSSCPLPGRALAVGDVTQQRALIFPRPRQVASSRDHHGGELVVCVTTTLFAPPAIVSF